MAAPWEISATQSAPPPVAPSAPWEPPVKQADGSGVNAGPPPSPPSPDIWGIPGSWIDAAKNLGTAAEKGLSDIVGMPGDIQHYLNQAYTPTTDQSQAPMGMSFLPDWFWKPGDPFSSLPANTPLLPGSAGQVQNALNQLVTNPPTSSDVQGVVKDVTGLNYTPSTSLGREVQAGGEMATAGLLGGPEMAVSSYLGGATQQWAKEVGAPDWLQTMFGLTVPVIAHTAVTAPESLVRQVARAKSATGQMGQAAQILTEAGGTPDYMATASQPPVETADATLGQVTDNLGILGLERSRFQDSPQAKATFQQIAQDANKATVEHLQQNAGGNWPSYGNSVLQQQQSSGAIKNQVNNAVTRAFGDGGIEDAAWNVVDPNRTTALDTGQLKQDVNNFVNSQTKTNKQYLPTDNINTINSFDPTEPLQEFQDQRSALRTEQRSQSAKGNYNQARLIGNLADVVDNHIANMTMPTPDLAAAYQNALSVSRGLHDTLDNPVIKAIQDGNASEVGSQIMTPEGFDAYYKATNGSPAAMQAARNHFLAGLADTAESKAAETQTLLPPRFNGYLNDNRTLLNDRRLFSQDQADALDRAGDQLNYSARTGRVDAALPGSQTYGLIRGDEATKAMVGEQTARLLAPAKAAMGAVGTGIGYLASHGLFPGQELVGSVLGGAASRLFGPSMEASAKNVLKYVDQALANPAFAERIQQYRPDPNATLLPSALQNVPGGIPRLPPTEIPPYSPLRSPLRNLSPLPRG